MRIGLIADTHMPGSLQALWPQALAAFQDVDCILHAGDLHTIEIVDQLSLLAPTYVSRGNGDAGLIDDRIQDSWLLDLAGISIGMIHRLPSPERKSAGDVFRYLDKHFEHRPQVLVFGHTHQEGLHQVENLLCINPGSPTLPRNQSLRLGTIGMLEIKEDLVTRAIYQITEAGIEVQQSISSKITVDNIP